MNTRDRYLLNFYPEGTSVYTICYYLAWPSGTIAFVKNLISVAHLYTAFYNIAVYDVSIDDTAKVAPPSKKPSSSPDKWNAAAPVHGEIRREPSDAGCIRREVSDVAFKEE